MCVAQNNASNLACIASYQTVDHKALRLYKRLYDCYLSLAIGSTIIPMQAVFATLSHLHGSIKYF